MIDRVLHRKPSIVSPTAASSVELARNFAESFNDKITTIRSELPPIDPIQSEAFASFDYSSLTANLKSFFEPTTTAELSLNVAKLSVKSSLLDTLPSSLLMKDLLDILSIITTNVNISLETSSVPLCLKKAVVTPLLKKLQLDHEIIYNFRPVSNLSFISQGY